MSNLSPRHEAFCESYARYSNATQAAKDAGYSERSAHAQGWRLLKDAEILNRVSEIKEARFKAVHMGPDETLAEIAKVARASMGRMLHITPAGDPYVDLNRADPDTLDAISEAVIEDFVDGREVDENGETIKRDVRRVKVKMHSKVAALTVLARAHGLLKDKVEITASDSFAETMARAQARVAQARGEGNADEG